MGVILAADGMGLAGKTILPMSARQVSWFIDPEAFLRHLADLQSVKISAYCRRCYQQGLPEDVTARFHPDKRQWTVQCACSEYPPIVDRECGKGPVLQVRKTEDDGTVTIIHLRSVDELLFRLGWALKCAGDCARKGMHDGAQGNNDSTTGTLRVACGCTDRLYHEPTLGRA